MKSFIGMGVCAFGALALFLASPVKAEISSIKSTTGDTAVQESTFNCTHQVTVKNLPAGAKKIRVWLPYPQDNDYQTAKNFNITSNVGKTAMETDKTHGNKFAFCEIENPKEAEYCFSYDFELTRKRRVFEAKGEYRLPNEKEAADMKEFLMGDRNSVVDDEVIALAEKVIGDEKDPVKMARKVYDWSIKHAEYWKKDKTKYAASGHGNTKYFIEKCTGNCTDFHAAFMSLMRAKGVPCRIEFGGVFWTDKDGKGEDLSYHCWAEFWVPENGWVVIDSSQADVEAEKIDFYFGNLESRRIVWTVGRDIDLAPKQDGDKLEFFSTAYVEVDGKPHKDFERKFTYKTVSEK